MEETTAARREAEELAEATFHPMTNPPMARRRGAPSTPGTESTDDLTGVNVTPAGFEKTVARMRAKRQYDSTSPVLISCVVVS
jgi:hypothetical protein